MAIFIVAAVETTPELESAIDEKYRGRSYRFAENVWFIASDDNPMDISESLGVKKGGIGGVVVMRGTATYYGMANAALWDWLKSAIEQSSNA